MSWVRSLLLVVIFGVCGGIIYQAFYVPFKNHRNVLIAELENVSDDLTDLEQRLLSLRRAGPEQVFPRDLLYVSASKSSAELSLQDSILALATANDISLITFGSSGYALDTSQDIVAFEFEAEGQLQNVQFFLASIEALIPKVAIGMLRVRQARSARFESSDDVQVYLQATVWSFWELQQ